MSHEAKRKIRDVNGRNDANGDACVLGVYECECGERFMSSLDSKFPTCPLNPHCMSPCRGCFVHEDCERNTELALRCLKDLKDLESPDASSK